MIKLDGLVFLPNYSKVDVTNKICETLKIKSNEIEEIIVIKKSVDARRKPNVKIIMSFLVKIKNEKNIKGFEFVKPDFAGLNYSYEESNLQSPVVVGFGPAGMFCALALSRMGLKPVVVEQGKEVEAREQDVLNFWKTGKLNLHSNVQFGEGGAGTFSDGKLNTNLNNSYCKKVINELIHMGAPQEIGFVSKPHIGSDNLKTVVKNIRNEIIKLGGQVLFNTKFVNYNVDNGKMCGVIVKNVVNNKNMEIKTNNLVLAVGHSARDTFNLICNKGIEIKQKPFAMGVRIEQLQQDVNNSQYGKMKKGLPSADYKLVAHLPNGRSVFTFCMCPGGVIINSSSEENEIVTNGMSNFLRNGKNANSAVLVNVNTADYNSEHPLAGIYFQKKYEQLAYELTKSNECPAQSVGEFLTGNKHEIKVEPSLKVKFCDIKKCLPKFVTESLVEGLPILNKKLKGFADYGNLLVAIESRSSCPITIVRDDNFESNLKGLYPCGEGAGFAGGIMSSAIDGIKIAEAIRKKN